VGCGRRSRHRNGPLLRFRGRRQVHLQSRLHRLLLHRQFRRYYNEVNLGIGYGIFALDVAIGTWDGFGTDADYTFTSSRSPLRKVRTTRSAASATDFDGDYFEAGYTYSLEDAGVDFTFALVYSDDLNVNNPDDGEDGDTTITFSIKKTIGVGK
jgi:hypothetical protein